MREKSQILLFTVMNNNLNLSMHGENWFTSDSFCCDDNKIDGTTKMKFDFFPPLGNFVFTFFKINLQCGEKMRLIKSKKRICGKIRKQCGFMRKNTIVRNNAEMCGKMRVALSPPVVNTLFFFCNFERGIKKMLQTYFVKPFQMTKHWHLPWKIPPPSLTSQCRDIICEEAHTVSWTLRWVVGKKAKKKEKINTFVCHFGK